MPSVLNFEPATFPGSLLERNFMDIEMQNDLEKFYLDTLDAVYLASYMTSKALERLQEKQENGEGLDIDACRICSETLLFCSQTQQHITSAIEMQGKGELCKSGDPKKKPKK